MVGVAFAHACQVLGPALLRHLQPAAQRQRQHGERIGHHFGQHPRTLAATGHEDAEQALLAQRRIGLVAQRQHFGADRVADQVDLVGMPCLQPLHVREAGGDGLHPAGQQAVDAAQHAVLFVHQRRDFGGDRRGQRRHGGVAAEADHRARLERLEQAQRHAPPFPHRLRSGEPAQRVLAEPPGGKDMGGQVVRLAWNVGTTLVRDQCNVMATSVQFGCKREGGDHVPARAARGQHVVTPRLPGRRRAHVRSTALLRPSIALRPGVSR